MSEFDGDTYRRGLTLGLTMAEIFMLILFLLLLAFLPLYKEYNQIKETLENKQAELTKITTQYEERASLPDEIQRLVRRNKELEKDISKAEKENTITQALLKKERERVLKDTQKFVEKISKEYNQAKEMLEDRQTELTKITTQYEERASLPNEEQRLVRKNKELERSLAKARKENTIIQKFFEKEQNLFLQDTRDLMEKVATLEIEVATLETDLAYATKGVDPPCWYKVVSRNGKRHEKPYYLLDVAVHDNYLLVRVNQNVPLPGSAIDENNQSALTTYKEEYEKLPLADVDTVKGKQISLEEFVKISDPIKLMGKNRQIRDYSCVFYAKIWDHTSATAKKRWQRAREKIENFFYPLLVRNDSWR